MRRTCLERPKVATALCSTGNCRRLAGHRGKHNNYPVEAWGFLEEKDAKKVNKAGYATPRGGSKGAYQNHVNRNSRVIIPYEKLPDVELDNYADGYVIRLFPDDYFASAGQPKAEFVNNPDAPEVGKNAFVLYRSHDAYERLPPLKSWKIRGLEKDGIPVSSRNRGAVDTGHYVLRMPKADALRLANSSGPPQGIFAPEYAEAEVNYLAKTMLTWLTVHTNGSPYCSTQALHVKAILDAERLLEDEKHRHLGMIRNGHTCCPLCLRIIDYCQLHNMVTFADTIGLDNAGAQVTGATRSTEANLFHLVPLVYASLQHQPLSIGWGHATCNTLLGQRRCYSLAELQDMDIKVATLSDGEVLTFGWMSENGRMIRGPYGATWVMLSDDMTSEEWQGVTIAHPTTPGDELLPREDIEAAAETAKDADTE